MSFPGLQGRDIDQSRSAPNQESPPHIAANLGLSVCNTKRIRGSLLIRAPLGTLDRGSLFSGRTANKSGRAGGTHRNEEKAREIAIRILDEFEALLAAKGIMVASDDREGLPGEARLYGEEESRLQAAIVGLLLEQADVTMTDHDIGDACHPLRQLAIWMLDDFEELLAAKDIMVPSDDREGRDEEACLYGSEYYELEDAVVGLLVEDVGTGWRGAEIASHDPTG